jgi:hypothetical protein
MVLIVGGQALVQCANADEYIHIFVNNNKKLTEFLEHMLKASLLCFCYAELFVSVKLGLNWPELMCLYSSTCTLF